MEISGLASHNAGSHANYFALLHLLEVGDHIEWQHDRGKRYYQVIEKQKIDSHDWSKLQPTLNNKITLITCVSEEPQKRWCIQAIEKEERHE